MCLLKNRRRPRSKIYFKSATQGSPQEAPFCRSSVRRHASGRWIEAGTSRLPPLHSWAKVGDALWIKWDDKETKCKTKKMDEQVSDCDRPVAGQEGAPTYCNPPFWHRSRCKVREVGVPYGWENRGTWAGINYFPAVPSNEAWKTVNAELAKTGDGTMFLVSGSLWVTKRNVTSGGPAFDDSAELAEPAKAAMLVKMAHASNGSTIWRDDQYDVETARQIWRGLSVELCHGHNGSQATLAAIFGQLRELGVSVASMDQEIGGQQAAPCYDPEHDHGPGFGTYIWSGYRDIVAQVQADSAAAGAQLGLSSEQTSELAIPWMGTYWSRQFALVDYPRQCSGTAAGACIEPGFEGVGLFSYVYHEYATAMAAALVQGQGGTGPTRRGVLFQVKAMADSLAMGLAMAPFDWMVQANVTREVNGYPAEWVRVTSDAFFAYAGVMPLFREWLVFGETLRPMRLRCANVSTFYWSAGGRRVEYSFPAAVAGTFRGMATTSDVGGAGGGVGQIGTVVVSAAAAAIRGGAGSAGGGPRAVRGRVPGALRGWPRLSGAGAGRPPGCEAFARSNTVESGTFIQPYTHINSTTSTTQCAELRILSAEQARATISELCPGIMSRIMTPTSKFS
eukprot:SAG22_NODE_782_length_7256_cov_8.627498_3_plen_620_part_00